MAITYRTPREILATPAEVAALGHEFSGATVIEVVDHVDEVPTGKTFLSGATGAAPSEIATTEAVAATVAQSVSATVTPASLVGSGAIALTQATHSGKAWHAEPGTTALTVSAAGWPSMGGGELSVINHTGADLPVQVGTGMTGYDNARGGRNVPGAASPATVLTLAYLERATIQVKEGMYCNVAVMGGSASERPWAASTYYRAGDPAIATAAQGTMGIGDRLVRTTAGTSRATFDATEAALWTERAEDPDVATAASLTDGSVNARFDRLRWDGATAITGTDLNALTIAGFYDGQTLTNAPNNAAGWFYILHQRHSNLSDVNWHHQTAYALGSGAGSTASESYVRTNVSGAWSAWVRTDNGALLASPTLTGTILLDGSPILGDGANHGQRTFSDVTGATMLVTNTTGTGSTTIATTDIAARFVKPGTASTKSNSTLDVVVGSHTAGANANTQVDFRLGNGAVNTPDVTVLTLKGNGDVLAGTNLVLDAGDLSATTPAMNGTAAVGTATTVARADHVHGTDTTRAPLSSPTFTDVPAAPTAAVDTNTTQIATTAWVNAQLSGTLPLMNGTATVGSGSRSVRGNHVHPTDTTRAPVADAALTGDVTLRQTAVGLGPTLTIDNENYSVLDSTRLIFEHGATQNAQAFIQSILPGANDVSLEFFTTNNSVLNATAALTLTGDNTALTATPASGTNTTQIATTAYVQTVATDGSISIRADRLRWDGALDLTSTDLNALIVGGMYDGQTMTNAPSTGWWYVWHQQHSNVADTTWAHQVAFGLGSGTGSTAGRMLTRTRTSGTWSAWVEYKHSGNTITGGGTLAAGTATITLAAAAVSSRVFVAKTSGTVTGVLRVSTKSAGSFVVTSSDGADTGAFDYVVYN